MQVFLSQTCRYESYTGKTINSTWILPYLDIIAILKRGIYISIYTPLSEPKYRRDRESIGLYTSPSFFFSLYIYNFVARGRDTCLYVSEGVKETACVSKRMISWRHCQAEQTINNGYVTATGSFFFAFPILFQLIPLHSFLFLFYLTLIRVLLTKDNIFHLKKEKKISSFIRRHLLISESFISCYFLFFLSD